MSKQKLDELKKKYEAACKRCEEEMKYEEELTWELVPFMIHKSWRSVLDPITCLFLSVLIDQYEHFIRRDGPSTDGFFQIPKESMYDFSQHVQDDCQENLKREGFLETKWKGSPPIQYFRLSFRNIDNDSPIRNQIIREITKEE